MTNVVVIMRTGVTAREVEKDRTECYEYQKLDGVKAREPRHVGLGHRYNPVTIPFSFGSCSSCRHISSGFSSVEWRH